MAGRAPCHDVPMEGGSLTSPERAVGEAHEGITADVLVTERTPDAIAIEVPPVSGTHHYLPALDGLRALAVLAVMAYHFGLHWADGGYLGVDLFFVLSGFLITGLLVGEWNRHRAIALRSFWYRRAKRLLPAVMLLLVTLSVYTWVGGPNVTPSVLRGDSISTLFYYANWHFIFSHQGYFAQYTIPSPLRHTWSLSIEEQFYVFWPLVVLGGFVLGARRAARRGPDRPSPTSGRRLLARPVAFWATVCFAAASAIEMIVFYDRGVDISRIYYGTDTRMFELLIGAALAMLVTGRPDHPPAVKTALHRTATVAALALGVLWVTAGDDAGNASSWMYRGGFLVACLLAAVVIAGVAQPDPGGLGRLLSNRPLRWIGRISYGLYLWHWPAAVLMTDVTTGLTGNELLAARTAATFAAATASFYLLERPVRRRAWRGWPFLAVMALGVAATATVVLLGTVSPAAVPAAVPKGGGQVALPAATARPDPLPAPITLPPGRVISRADPLRVLALGDSVMYDGEVGIQAALQASGEAVVTPHAALGWGLVNDHTFQADLAGAIAQDRPEVILMMWSWDNGMAHDQPTEFRHLLDQAFAVMLAPGSGVDGIAIVQFPRVGPLDAYVDPGQRHRALVAAEVNREAFDRIVSALPRQYPRRVTYLPIAHLFDDNGTYSAWLPTTNGGWIRARKVDNTHLCPAGAAVLGAGIAQELHWLFHLTPPAPGWVDGSWTRDPVRFGVPGDCPDDQPPHH